MSTTLSVIRGGRYCGRMGDLPKPAKALTLAEIQADFQQVYEDLEQGGVVVVLGDRGSAHESWVLGALTREPRVLDEAEVAQWIADGHIPPLDELLAQADPSLDEPAGA